MNAIRYAHKKRNAKVGAFALSPNSFFLALELDWIGLRRFVGTGLIGWGIRGAL